MYGLVHNNRIVVGPRKWNRAFFLDYLTKNGLDTASLVYDAPNAPIVTDDWKILPVTTILTPAIEKPYQKLIGPAWTIGDDNITGEYTVSDNDISNVKAELKQTVSRYRYDVEVSGTTYFFGDLQEVSVSTSRSDRDVFVSYYSTMAEDETISFKFKNGVFRDSITRTEVKAIADLIKNHIKDAFVWESQKWAEIDVCTTFDQLKNIELRNDYQINNPNDPTVISLGPA
jgi:hypothetical protein